MKYLSRIVDWIKGYGYESLASGGVEYSML
jgi:hypothetical protein